jgi:hypothetical protein
LDDTKQVIVLLLALLILVPNAAMAGGRGGVVVVAPHGKVVVAKPSVVRRGPFVVVPTPSVFPTIVDPWKFWGVTAFPRRVFPRHAFPLVESAPLIGGGAIASTTVYVGAPAAAYGPAAYAPADAIAPALPSAPPVPALIEYPTGWYQLRGDGVSAPYAWVWIPKPPAPPLEVAGPPPPAAPAPAEPAASRAPRGQLFRWVDDQDVIHWTDRLDRIPPRYRAKAEQVS